MSQAGNDEAASEDGLTEARDAAAELVSGEAPAAEGNWSVPCRRTPAPANNASRRRLVTSTLFDDGAATPNSRCRFTAENQLTNGRRYHVHHIYTALTVESDLPFEPKETPFRHGALRGPTHQTAA